MQQRNERADFEKNPVVIASAIRTPIGNLLGELESFSAPQLGAKAIQVAIAKAGLQPTDIDEVLMGCVLPAGQGQAPARQAALLGNIPNTVPCTTLNKVCGSGMKAIMSARNNLLVGENKIIVAGGMESMSNAPYLLLKARGGYRLGADTLYDHMTLDGLEDAYDKGRAMGYFAEQCAQQYQFTRKEQDDYALTSFKRAKEATQAKYFSKEICTLVQITKQGENIIEKDEHPFSVNPEKIPNLSPAFMQNGTVTAGNSSSIADGAAALVLTTLEEAEKRGIKPIARLVGQSMAAKAPSEFTTAPIDAVSVLLKKLNWTTDHIDLFEINEAFAVVALIFMRTLNVPHEKINIYGGACALGHPIGASGARIIVTLLSALAQNNMKRGIAALCIGGGEATAVAIEMM